MTRTFPLIPLLLLFGCPVKDPGGTFGDGGTKVPRLDGGIIVDPGDAGVITPPDGSVVDGTYDSCADFEHASLEVPIIINDQQNAVARQPGMTSFLVPFARGEAIFSLNSLVVYDGAARLPAQFETLSRWGSSPDDCGAPIRFAYAHVRALPAPGGTAAWTVRSEVDPPDEASPLTITESADSWTIDTGAAQFTVRRDRFALSRVVVGGSVVSDLGGQPGFVLESQGTKTTDAIAPWYAAIERRGPQTVTLAARGRYAAGDLAYTIRLHFYADSAVAKIDHTYYHGDVAEWGADGAYNSRRIQRAYMNVPLAEPATAVRIRGDTQIHDLGPSDVKLEQEKRLPSNQEVRFNIRSGGVVENGRWARAPFLSVATQNHRVRGTIARMMFRDPQGLSYDSASNSLRLEFTSSEIQVGGARGIWSSGAIDFAADSADAQADALQLHAERPLLGTPSPSYVNTTQTIGPYATDETGVGATLFPLLADIHENTRAYYEDLAITGIQIWPDLTRDSCYQTFDCDTARNFFYEGGDNNYWNWSKPGVDEFFRTGNNDFLYDFSLGEARTYAETIAFRTYHDQIDDSSVMGLAPCPGDSRGFSGDFQEGLNQRRDNCPADYSYSKTLKVAYLATADRRFVDYFEEAGVSVVNTFGLPPQQTEPYLELTLSRLSEQRLENLANGAEFAKDPETSEYLRNKLTDYVNFMLGRTLIDGHACDTASTGLNDARDLGNCWSISGWMAPVPVEWALRSARFLSHQALTDWVARHGQQSAANMTVQSGGLPDYSAASGVPGWRVGYGCDTNGNGVVDSTCQPYSGGENDSYFYENGLMAFLNVFGLSLAANLDDPGRVCDWLPAAYQSHVANISDFEINQRVWGKSSGQAFAMSAETAGALSMCR